jgi:phosphoglycolate phosphatase-like HAD superfamily hydrolase
VNSLPTSKLQIKALLLDLDGTLVNSTEALKEAGRAGFAALGLSPFRNDEIAYEVARRLEQDLPIDDLFTTSDQHREVEERFLPAYLDAYYSAVTSKSKPFPKTKETLRALSRRVPLALITLRYVVREQIIDELERFGLRKFFRVVVTALDVEKPKPSPDALLVAARKLSVPVSQCAIVGDSIVDIQAGKAAGAKTVAVLSGLFRKAELEAQMPDLVVETVADLPMNLCKLEFKF